MEPIQIRVTRIIDFGTIVSIVGFDAATNRPVMVHVDHRPFQDIWDAWKAANFPQPIEFDADRLTLNLNLDPSESFHGDGADAAA